MEGRKEKPVKIDWQKLESEAWHYEMMHVSTPESELLRIQESVMGQIDAYIRDGGLDRDVAEIDSMFRDEIDLGERIDAIGKSTWLPGGEDPTVIKGPMGKYRYRLSIKRDSSDPSGKTIVAGWVPCFGIVRCESTVQDKECIRNMTDGLAARKGHTTMDTIRKILLDRVVSAEEEMDVRRQSASGKVVRLAGVPSGISSYSEYCRWKYFNGIGGYAPYGKEGKEKEKCWRKEK